MKHLFIILISILLLSFPLYGQETGVLFLSLENGELVYYEEGDDEMKGNMLVKLIMGNQMVKEPSFGLMEQSM